MAKGCRLSGEARLGPGPDRYGSGQLPRAVAGAWQPALAGVGNGAELAGGRSRHNVRVAFEVPDREA
jgi:hypothetical protein